jgi:hypothetical protein
MTTKVISLSCCEPAKLYIRLDFTSDTSLAFDLADLPSKKEVIAWIEQHPPAWVLVFEGENQIKRRLAIRFCPFCGKSVPDVERNPKPPKKLSMPVEPGYCATCINRLIACTCFPLQFLFRGKL